ncbi:MAG TPA: hypothetical protein VGL38_12825 [bacterium]
MRRFFFRICCALIFLAICLCTGVGCNHAKRAGRETGTVSPRPPTAREHAGAPTCSYVVDDSGNLILDLNECRTLQDDSSCVVLKGSSLGRPIYLTHIEDQIFYALDSRCAQGGCNATVHGKEFVCPCDSTHYALTGAILRGPASTGLRELPSLKNGNRIRVTPR